jgi:hypothetical protein
VELIKPRGIGFAIRHALQCDCRVHLRGKRLFARILNGLRGACRYTKTAPEPLTVNASCQHGRRRHNPTMLCAEAILSRI